MITTFGGTCNTTCSSLLLVEDLETEGGLGGLFPVDRRWGVGFRC